LTSIRSFAEILLEYDDEDPETKKEFMEIIRVESERLTRLINDFLDLSKIEAGGMVYNDDFISLEGIIKEVTKHQHQLLEEKSLVLELDIFPQLPLVYADRDRLQQVITNLLGNAIKFSLQGNEIRIRAQRFEGKRSNEASEWIKVSVSDQGIGVEEKDFDLIFDKFRQGSCDTLEEKPKGTGLGLPICKEIISHYEGNIWVESEKGKGSTFSFTLPTATENVKPEGDSLTAKEQPAGKTSKTIVVANEDGKTRRILRDQLERNGFTVLEAPDANKTLELVQEQHVHLILLDLMIPEMGEDDLFSTIRADPLTENIPVLSISVGEECVDGILTGAHDFLKKPFREEDLVRKIQALLEDRCRSILVVDDDPAVRSTLRMRLEDKGYLVYAAQDGAEALALLEVSIPDLVILDYVMPKKNGYDVLTWMRNNVHTRHLPAIILTGYPLPGEQGRLLSLGAEAFVEKSEGMSSLFRKIDSLLRSPMN
jgi:CheY-like chemotaxis protein/anti-sigma regulatory factor (Ser/Thr protein kinase)